jgi:hypothetical protein
MRPVVRQDSPPGSAPDAPIRPVVLRAAAQASFPTWKEWWLFLIQIVVVTCIEVSDDLLRGLVFPRDIAATQANAVRVMDFEQDHSLWIEPSLQRFFEQTHHILGLAVTWPHVVTVFNSLYGIAHGLVTALVVTWLYWRRPNLFPFVRNVFAIATTLSVVTYNAFPTAPPRLATGLRFDGAPFHFEDTVFASGGVNLSFDKYAAVPSLHIVWALIAGLSLAIAARQPIIRLIGLAHPFLMAISVMVTGNHYLFDCLAAAAITGIAFLISVLLLRWPKIAFIGGRASWGPPLQIAGIRPRRL